MCKCSNFYLRIKRIWIYVVYLTRFSQFLNTYVLSIRKTTEKLQQQKTHEIVDISDFHKNKFVFCCNPKNNNSKNFKFSP